MNCIVRVSHGPLILGLCILLWLTSSLVKLTERGAISQIPVDASLCMHASRKPTVTYQYYLCRRRASKDEDDGFPSCCTLPPRVWNTRTNVFLATAASPVSASPLSSLVSIQELSSR
ncbi:hypothetical protein F5Y10DRAFT_255119 [Nemania abortiva]|nr:hypothetical protein F5Y10DRAFT_255119 [Nemania abortiva]